MKETDRGKKGGEGRGRATQSQKNTHTQTAIKRKQTPNETKHG